MIGSEEVKKKERTYIQRPMKEITSQKVTLRQEAVHTFDTDKNQIETTTGQRYQYNYLVLAPGIVMRWDQIQGAQDALEDPNSPVGSIYHLPYAYKMSQLRENFKGGKAVFVLPKMPIKCGGAPQKIMYLAEETFRKNGVRDKTDIHFHSFAGDMFPNCKKYADKLALIKTSKGITSHFTQTVFKVDKDQRKVYFKDNKTQEVSEQSYDLLHLVPPQSTPDYILKSGLIAPNGFIDVDAQTLRHNKAENIYALGDAANLPTAKTAAGAFSQAPVVVQNILQQMDRKYLNGHYDGYSSCPVFVGDNKLMMIEFKYENQPSETFYSG